MLTFSKLKYANRIRNDTHYKHLHTHKLYLTTKVVGEAGEIAANMAREYRKAPYDKDKLAQHFADLVICLDVLAQECGISLEQSVRDRFNEVSSELGASIFISLEGEIERRKK